MDPGLIVTIVAIVYLLMAFLVGGVVAGLMHREDDDDDPFAPLAGCLWPLAIVVGLIFITASSGARIGRRIRANLKD
jgi:Na+/proline symporter